MVNTATSPAIAKLHALDGEDLFLLPAARPLFPSRTNRATIFRWATRGVRIRDNRIRLECVKIGAYLYTSREAVKRFIAALNAPASDAGPASILTAGQSARAAKWSKARAERAGKKLQRMGL
jgi:hypothetical protein